jgi:hypothetical protein
VASRIDRWLESTEESRRERGVAEESAFKMTLRPPLDALWLLGILVAGIGWAWLVFRGFDSMPTGINVMFVLGNLLILASIGAELAARAAVRRRDGAG